MRNYVVFEKSLSDAGVVVLRETKELMRNHWIVMTHNNDDDDCGGEWTAVVVCHICRESGKIKYYKFQKYSNYPANASSSVVDEYESVQFVRSRQTMQNTQQTLHHADDDNENSKRNFFSQHKNLSLSLKNNFICRIPEYIFSIFPALFTLLSLKTNGKINSIMLFVTNSMWRLNWKLKWWGDIIWFW